MNRFSLLSSNTAEGRLAQNTRVGFSTVAHKESVDARYRELQERVPGEIETCNFISEVIDPWADSPGQLAIRQLDDEQGYTDISYGELVRRSRTLAQHFTTMGVTQGSAVALMLGQDPAWWYSTVGLMRAGIAIVPCPRLLTSSDVLYRLNDLGISGIVASQESQSRLDAIRNKAPSLKVMLTTGPATEGWQSVERIIEEPTDINQVPAHITTDDPCIYLYTSGTTGLPKAVLHNMDYPFFHWNTSRRWMQVTPEDMVCNASDTGWGFTAWTTFGAWIGGASILTLPVQEKFDPKRIFHVLETQPITIFCAAPTVLRLMAADPTFDQACFPTVERIVTVGEPLDSTVLNAFAAKGIKVYVGYGQAETPLLIGRVDQQLHETGTMGLPIEPYRIVVLDDDFKPLESGVGQLAVDLSGAQGGITRGYANAPEKTAKLRSPCGRYHLTGDVAERRLDGHFRFLGRSDDLIKSFGYRIGPNEVENAVMSHPAIAKVAAVGVRADRVSEAQTLKAYVLLKTNIPETDALKQDIQRHVKRKTAPYMYPREIEFLSMEQWGLYETTSGKIRRDLLRERHNEQLEKGAPQQHSIGLFSAAPVSLEKPKSQSEDAGYHSSVKLTA